MSIPHTKRVCQIIKLKPEFVDEYKSIHAAVWPAVLDSLAKHHITDYSIHHSPSPQLLIATFKYTGTDYEADMKDAAEDPETQRWWKVTDGMQESFVEGAIGSKDGPGWWTELEEVFRYDTPTAEK